MNLALFDLDYTLLPIDSDHAWSHFLIDRGVVDGPEWTRKADDFFTQYKAGTLDIHAYLAFALAPLAQHPRATLDAWHREFMDEVIRPAVRPAAVALVERHRSHGDLCCVVTATNAFVTRPIAQAFGIGHLVAIELEERDGRYTGRVSGTPSFREGKILRVGQWLATQGLSWQSFGQTTFYSDSINDLPLLERVTHPVATNPDQRLLEIARAREWPVLDLFQ